MLPWNAIDGLKLQVILRTGVLDTSNDILSSPANRRLATAAQPHPGPDTISTARDSAHCERRGVSMALYCAAKVLSGRNTDVFRNE